MHDARVRGMSRQMQPVLVALQMHFTLAPDHGLRLYFALNVHQLLLGHCRWKPRTDLRNDLDWQGVIHWSELLMFTIVFDLSTFWAMK